MTSDRQDQRETRSTGFDLAVLFLFLFHLEAFSGHFVSAVNVLL